MNRLFVLLTVLATALALAVPAPAARPDRNAGDPGPENQSETITAGDVDVIIHTAKPYDDVVDAVEHLGGSVNIEYENADAIAATVPALAVSELSARSDVDVIENDVVIQLPTPRESQFETQVLDHPDVRMLSSSDLEALTDAPDLYYSYLSDVTGAQSVWDDTGFGADSLVAVIDTGTAPDGFCLPSGRVTEGPDFSPDAGTPAEGSTSPDNHWHGTFVANVAAANCAIGLFTGSPLEQIFTEHLPPEAFFKLPGPGITVVPLLGMAPAAEIYAVKVFPASGSGVPTSIINQALDHVVSQKSSGALDIDVVNMSLGGASLYDGFTLNEKLVDAATDAGMTVVAAAGNEGPAPSSIARPGSAFTALTAAAASDPVHTRILWDVAFGPGQGLAMYPVHEIRPSDFSSRGPLGDGRVSPDVTATGVFNFALFTPPFCPGTSFCFGWASGTSFSTPTVAGGVALLNAWAENNNPSIGPDQIRNVIKDGADPLAGEWSELAQGAGYLDVSDSLDLLKSGNTNSGLALRHDHLQPSVLRGNKSEVSQTVTLAPGRTADWVFEIKDTTDRVEIDIDIDGPIDPGPGAIPNSFEFYVKSAKRGGAPYVIDTANVIDDASAVIGDGFVTLDGGFVDPLDVEPNQWPMEPGLMKVTLESDWTNNAPALTATVTIRRIDGAPTPQAGGITETISQDEFGVFPVVIPEGTTEATFDLSWKKDWAAFPTNDLDLLFVSPDSFPFLALDFLDGATLNAPERQVISDPDPGTWFVVVNGFSVWHGRDLYVLDITLQD